MTKRHVIPVFQRWRRGEIPTLNDAGIAVTAAVRDELTGPENQGLVRAVSDWLDSLRPNLDELTGPICRRWGVPPSAMQLPPIRDWQVPEVPADQTNTMTDALQDALAVVVAGMLARKMLGAGMAVSIGTGPFLFVIVSVALMIGKKRLIERAMTANLPLRVRKLGSEEKVVEALLEQAETREAEFARELSDRFQTDSGAEVAHAVAEQPKKELQRLAGDAEPLISPEPDTLR